MIQGRMLIVDDIEMNREILRAYFESDYEIEEAENGQAAIEHLYRRNADIIITDILMPEMDGLELIREIRQNPLFEKIKIIAITESGEQYELEALHAGADDFINKPFQIELLQHRIHALTSQDKLTTRMMAQHFTYNQIRIPFATVSIGQGGESLRYQYVNMAYAELFHSTPEKMLQESDFDIMPGFCEFIVQVNRDGHGKQTFYDSRCDEYFDVTAYDEGGHFCSYIMTKNENEKLHRYEKERVMLLVREIMELNPDAIGVAMLQFGKDHAQVLHSNIRGVVHEECEIQRMAEDLLKRVILDTDREAVQKMLDPEEVNQAYGEGTHLLKKEITTLSADGNLLTIDMTMRLLKNSYTRQVEGIILCRDITEEKLTQKVIELIIGQRYDTLFCINLLNDTAKVYCGDGSLFMDGPYNMTDVNQSIDHYLQEHYVGDDKEQFCIENQISSIAEKMKQLDQYVVEYELLELDGRIHRKRGCYYWLDSARYRLCFIRSDITEEYDQEQNRTAELKQLLEKAEAANIAKSNFLSRISHDMRTPLNGIIGLANLMKERTNREEMERDLMQMQLSGQYLLNLVNDTLDVSAIEQNKLELHPTVCDGREAINDIHEFIRASIGNKKIQFKTKIEVKQYAMLFIDLGRIEQLIMNIVGNAIKFSPENGVVEFTMRNLSFEEEEIVDEIVVRDYGIGISPEFLPHIFEPFSQENTSRTSIYDGTGLGLAISKQIVEKMGGTIQIDSTPGAGTTVTFTLVLKRAGKEQLEAVHGHRDPQGLTPKFGGKHFLMCEDHPLNAKIVQKLLEKQGAAVETAENGEIGLKMFENSPEYYYDAVLMDIRMPVMDGMETTARIRGLNRADAECVPIVAITANTLEEDVQSSRESGMNAHIAKPIEPEKLYQTLFNVMEVNTI